MAGRGASPAPAAAVQVRCAGCRGVLAVAPGMTEFICPKCRMAQCLPPELMPPPSPPKASPTPPPSAPTPPPAPAPAPPPSLPAPHPPVPPTRRSAPRAQGVDPTKIQLPCARCKAVLNVPHGLARFRCPQCGVDLAVDMSKLHHFLASAGGFVPPPMPPPPPVPMPHMPFLPMMPPHLPVPMAPMFPPAAEPPEEINEVAVDVELDEDEGGTFGETFTDYGLSRGGSGAYNSRPPVPEERRANRERVEVARKKKEEERKTAARRKKRKEDNDALNLEREARGQSPVSTPPDSDSEDGGQGVDDDASSVRRDAPPVSPPPSPRAAEHESRQAVPTRRRSARPAVARSGDVRAGSATGGSARPPVSGGEHAPSRGSCGSRVAAPSSTLKKRKLSGVSRRSTTSPAPVSLAPTKALKVGAGATPRNAPPPPPTERTRGPASDALPPQAGQSRGPATTAGSYRKALEEGRQRALEEGRQRARAEMGAGGGEDLGFEGHAAEASREMAGPEPTRDTPQARAGESGVDTGHVAEQEMWDAQQTRGSELQDLLERAIALHKDGGTPLHRELRRKADVKSDLLADLFVEVHELTVRAEAAEGEARQLRRTAGAAAEAEHGRAEELAHLRDTLAQTRQARTSAEGQLGQERKARADAEEQLRQGRAALETARTQLEQECKARSNAEGQLQAARTALGAAEARVEQEHKARLEAEAALQQERSALEAGRVQLQEKAAAVEASRAALQTAEEAVSQLTQNLDSRVRDALLVGVKKTLGVVSTHYQVDLAALEDGYIVEEDLSDDQVVAAIDQADAAAMPVAEKLATFFEGELFPDEGGDAEDDAPPA